MWDRDTRRVVALMAAAFALRLGARLSQGQVDYFLNGYSRYLTIARTLLNGQGFCPAPGAACASREPLYALFVAPFVAGGDPFHGVVIAQSALGAWMVWLSWRIGHALFDRRAAWVAAIATAVSPYAVVHDTAFQDTILVNALTLASLTLWLRAARADVTAPFAAGFVGTLAALTSARMLPAVLVWIASLAIAGRGPWRARWRPVAAATLPLVILMGAWIARNHLTTGAPVVSSETGSRLWTANNDWTFSHFPAESIDASYREAIDHLDSPRRAALATSGDSLAADRLFGRWGLEWIAHHPLRAAGGAARKAWVVVSATLSPARSTWPQLGYRAFFLPIHVLAAVALWRSRTSWRSHAPSYALLLSFFATTMIFWAHTSHASVIEPVLFVYAGAALQSASRSLHKS